MGYYGITFSATNLSDDFYLNYELSMQVCSLHIRNEVLLFIFIIDGIFLYL